VSFGAVSFELAVPRRLKTKSPLRAAFQIGVLLNGPDGVAQIIGASLLFVVPPDGGNKIGISEPPPDPEGWRP